MFTGIIETLGEVIGIKKEKTNITISCKSSISSQLRVDQSVSHNGVCLTVIYIKDDVHKVTIVKETLQKSNLGILTLGSNINLERSMKLNARLDGHIVQGHIDQTAICTQIKEQGEGSSYLYTFKYESSSNIVVEKGSICINGVSLTVFNCKNNSFSVAIIPYTFENTNFHLLEVGDAVNIEFDILGKYITKLNSRS